MPVLSGTGGDRRQGHPALHLKRMCLTSDMTGADRAALDFAIDKEFFTVAGTRRVRVILLLVLKGTKKRGGKELPPRA